MSDPVEDLYLKGFMAYSSKDFSAAKAFWEQALAQDPGHEKTLKGMAELGKLKPKKRSSKEVLAQIKQLYAAKKYAEALKLCGLLVKKHPNNVDLKGLYRKIENRLSAQQAERTGVPADINQTIQAPGEADRGTTTQVLANRSEASIEEAEGETSAEDSAEQAERLIQEGVNYYEVESYDQAIQSWEKALALDPQNRIAKDYIKNVTPLLAREQEAPEPPPTTAAPEPPPSDKPTKDDLLNIYNEGMGLYKNRQYDEAMEKWNYILKFHPNHAATLQCVEKTKVALSKQEGHKKKLEEAREALASGNHTEAERIVTKLSIEAPGLDGLEQLGEAIRERQKQITEIRSLDIEETDAPESAAPVDDEEITRFFTPETDDGRSAPRQVAQVAVSARDTRSGKGWVWAVVAAAVVGLAVAGFVFGPDLLQRQYAVEEAQIAPLVRRVDWNSQQQAADDFLQIGKNFNVAEEHLLSHYAFRRVIDIAEERMEELRSADYAGLDFEILDEQNVLLDKKREARALAEESLIKLIPADLDPKAVERARAEIKRGLYAEASERLMALLANERDNNNVRQLAGETEIKIAFEMLSQNELDEAVDHFRRAAVLMADFDLARRNVEVITRFFGGKITTVEKDQWFFFFKD